MINNVAAGARITHSNLTFVLLTIIPTPLQFLLGAEIQTTGLGTILSFNPYHTM